MFFSIVITVVEVVYFQKVRLLPLAARIKSLSSVLIPPLRRVHLLDMVPRPPQDGTIFVLIVQDDVFRRPRARTSTTSYGGLMTPILLWSNTTV